MEFVIIGFFALCLYFALSRLKDDGGEVKKRSGFRPNRSED